MAIITTADRVRETTNTTGTGTLSLDGAVSNYQSFIDGVGDGSVVTYCIIHRNSNEWEVGYGTITNATPDTLSRTYISFSSNSGSVVNLSSGTKDVFITHSSEFVVTKNTDGKINVEDGGTNISSYSSGDLIYASDATTLSKLSTASAGNALLSGTSPSWGKITSGHVDSSIMLSGTVPTAIVVANESTDTTCFPLFATAASGSLAPKTNANLTYNSSSGIFTATGLYAVEASNPSVRVANDLSGTRKELSLGIYTGSGVVSLKGFDYNTYAYLPIYFNDGTVNISAAGVLTAFSFVGPLTGNASTATALQTTRTIGGSNFNGSANVTSFPTPGAIGGTTPSTIAATSLACPTFTSPAAMGFTPVAGSGFNITLSGAGDFAVNTDQLYVDSSTGNVGIGTTSPSDKLHVSNGNLRSSNTANSLYTQLGEQFVRTYGGSLYHDVASTGYSMIFRLSNGSSLDTEAMRINSLGNVGIGTTSPNYKLAIDSSSGNYFASALLSASMGTSGNWVGQLYGYTGNTYQKAATIFESSDSYGRGKFYIALNDATNSGNVSISDAKLTVDYNGTVGIGITTPTALCHLGASTTARASLCIPSGTAPTSPVAGDIWYDGTNLKFRDGGTTRTLTWV